MNVVLKGQRKAIKSFSEGDNMTFHHYSNLFTHPPTTSKPGSAGLITLT